MRLTRTIGEEFQEYLDARAQELRAPRTETKHERQARLAARFTADVEPLFDQTAPTTLEPTDDGAFNTEALDKLLTDKE